MARASRNKKGWKMRTIVVESASKPVKCRCGNLFVHRLALLWTSGLGALGASWSPEGRP